VFDLAAAADQDADLALDLARDPAQIGGQLGRCDLPGTKPAAVDALERMLLAGLEPGDIAGDDVQGAEVSIRGPGARRVNARGPLLQLPPASASPLALSR
jgi:hypothetical protein